MTKALKITRGVAKNKIRIKQQKLKDQQALKAAGLTTIQDLGFPSPNKPPKANVELTKTVLETLWREGEGFANGKGKTLSMIVVTFEPSYKTTHRWENQHNGVVPFSKYPEMEMVVEYLDEGKQIIETPPTAVYESLVHRMSYHHLWSKGVPNIYDVLDFMIVKAQAPGGFLWVSAFPNDLFFDKNAIDQLTAN